MSDTSVTLTKAQISLIKKRIQHEGVKTSELAEDLLDYFCVAVEEKIREGETFESAFENAFNALQEDELKATEMKTQELLEGKKPYYPNLLQSFLLALSTLPIALVVSWLVFQAVWILAVGIGDLALREQWVKQTYLLNAAITNVFALGVPIGYTIWRKRQTQIKPPIFSFRIVPAYVYGVILLFGLSSSFWLEPLIIFFPFSQQDRELGLAMLENVDPLLVVLVNVGAMILLELLFRGIILRGLLMTMTPIWAIFWSSLFCAITMYAYFPYILLFSLLSGWIYWKARSLYPSIFLVTAFPLVVYAIFSFLGYSDSYLQFTWWDYVDYKLLIYLPLVIGSSLLTAGLLYYLNRRLSAESTV